MSRETTYADTCEVTNIKSGKVVTGEILRFNPKKNIVLTINRQVKLTLVYQPNVDLYIGNMAGMEFQSSGPEAYTYRTHR